MTHVPDLPSTFDALVAAGDAMRRSGGLGDAASAMATDATLGALGAGEVAAWIASVDIERETRRLSRAIDEAFELLLATTPKERRDFAASALGELSHRDHLESAFAAVARWEALGHALPAADRDRFTQVRAAIAQVDGAARASAVSLVALNDTRRVERDRLSAEHRARAWWWTARAECDAMEELLRGSVGEVDERAVAAAEHASQCAECRRDRDQMRVIDAPPMRHVTADELWRFDTGAMTNDERRRASRHAERCVDCKLALDALAHAERAIEDATDDAAIARASMGATDAGGKPNVTEHAAFRVEVRREAKRVRVLVLERGAAKVREATLSIGGARLRRTAQGVELAVAASAWGKASRAELVVVLASGERVVVALALRARSKH